MSWREDTIECLKCDHRYTEINKEFIEVCPFCGNDDVLETIYVTTDEELK
jgi:predicted  nucleic acid-binding Zn-ribbon protein